MQKGEPATTTNQSFIYKASAKTATNTLPLATSACFHVSTLKISVILDVFAFNCNTTLPLLFHLQFHFSSPEFILKQRKRQEKLSSSLEHIYVFPIIPYICVLAKRPRHRPKKFSNFVFKERF